MKILVSGTTLNVTNAYAERGSAITLYIHVPYVEMDYAGLKALFKGNTGDIVKTADDDSTELFSGFTYSNIVDDDANEVYIVKLSATEYDFQLGRNRQLEADKASLESTVASKENEITNLNTSIAEKDTKIAEQEETINAKDTAISEKEVTITEQAATIETQTATIAELEQTIASKDEEIATLAEQCADLLYASAIEEIGATATESESEVI